MSTTDVPGFLDRWATVVSRHAAADAAERAALVRAVLESGIDAVIGGSDSAADTPAPPDPTDRLICELDLVAASGELDELDYLLRNPDLAWHLCQHREQLRHFVAGGWRHLRAPSGHVDLWWYWRTHLDATRDDLNPLVHWLAEGRHLGLPSHPEVGPLREPQPPPASPRRVCLFAGYDPDGVVDDTVVAYVRELSRFAEVYYLADGELAPDELGKLAPYTRGAWAVRHGGYDFGSYAMLARDLVGWDQVATYDELLIANDSCYLVRPLDEVFETMDVTPCDWWGLQATYDAFSPRDQERVGRPLALDEVVAGIRSLGGRMHTRERTGPAGTDVSDPRFHVGTYFAAFRSPVVADPSFRRLLDEVVVQPDKTSIVRKYEIGLTRTLLLAGFRLATFVPDVLAFHPVYRASAFELIRSGFPLLKRQLLARNPYETPGLSRWQERVLEASPGADVAAMSRNLVRVTDPWQLHRSLSFSEGPDGTVVLATTVAPEDFEDEDRRLPKHADWWVFPADPVTGRLEGNARAVLEVVRHDPAIKKILLTDTGTSQLTGTNLTVAAPDSPEAQFYLLRAGQILVSRGPRSDVDHPLSGDLHQFVLLGRGSPLLAFGAAVPVAADVDAHLRHNVRVHDLDLTRAVVVASRTQAKALWASLAAPSRRPQRWVTGSPRTDLLVSEELPDDLRAQEEEVRTQTAARPLVVWLAAERETGEATRLSEEAAAGMLALADQHGAVVGVRDLQTVDGAHQGLLDLSAEQFPDVETVLRVADVLVSDYAPELVDFLVTDRPVVCFAPDLDSVRTDPGLVHDLDRLLPGGAQRTPADLLTALEAALGAVGAAPSADYTEVRDLLHAHRDGRCGRRVVRRILASYAPDPSGQG